MTQAEDRCHRSGQKDSVLVQHMVVEGSIDVNMANTIIEKQDVLDRDSFGQVDGVSILKFESSMRDVDFSESDEKVKEMTLSDAQRWGRFLQYLINKNMKMSESDRELANHILSKGPKFVTDEYA